MTICQNSLDRQTNILLKAIVLKVHGATFQNLINSEKLKINERALKRTKKDGGKIKVNQHKVKC